ncbi:dihydrofolate reductase [bacterium]|nr:dihydrofolate reductase [bacterium]
MRKLKLVEHISLDGVIQIGGGPSDISGFPYGDWSAPYRTPEGLSVILEAFGARYDLLLGRGTYDQWSGYWPNAPQSPIADGINAATKFVVTHRPESLAWGPAEAVGPGLVEGVRQLKATDGPDLILSGSMSLTSTILEHDLADELLLLVYPLLLGKGQRIMAEGSSPRAFTLDRTFPMPSGIVVQSYRAEGTLRNLR